MSTGERPKGAAKGKHPNTEALCQPPPPLSPVLIHGLPPPAPHRLPITPSPPGPRPLRPRATP